MRNPQNETAKRIAERAPAQAGAQSENKKSGLLPSQEHSHARERTCVLTRRKGTRADLIRLALGPDGQVAPDVRARAPGRGAWIGVTRAELDDANRKGKLKATLQRAFKTQAVTVPADLGERTEAALRQAALDRLGIEARAGNLINGADKVDNAARAGKVALLVHAGDASEDGRRKLDQGWRVGGGGPDRQTEGMIFPEARTILSMALGRDNVVHVALTDPAAASRVSHALKRWRNFTGPDCGPEGGEPALETNSAEADLTKE